MASRVAIAHAEQMAGPSDTESHLVGRDRNSAALSIHDFHGDERNVRAVGGDVCSVRFEHDGPGFASGFNLGFSNDFAFVVIAPGA